jgi:hypothetical protein
VTCTVCRGVEGGVRIFPTPSRGFVERALHVFHELAHGEEVSACLPEGKQRFYRSNCLGGWAIIGCEEG